MLHRLLVAALLAAPAALFAQDPQVSLQTATDVAALTTLGSQTDFKVVPRNTPIPSVSKSVNLKVHLDNKAGGYTTIYTMAYPNYAGTGVNVMERGYMRGLKGDQGGTSASAQAGGARLGAHSYLMTVTGNPGTLGRFVMSWHSKGELGASMKGAFDIGDDNQVEWSGGGTGTVALRREFPMSIPKSGRIVVRLTTEGVAPGSGSYQDWVNYFTDFFVSYLPDKSTKCTATKYGTGCGPTLTPLVVTGQNNHVVNLMLAGAYPNAFALSFIGTQSLNIPLGGGCTLLANGVVIKVHQTDAKGEALESWKIPLTEIIRSHHQFLPLDLQGANLVFKATNGVKIECRR